ncbi:MAG: PD-(D/E)XK nuclease family protein [Halanaerobium sp.]
MAQKNLNELYFSQSALSIFNKCRRRFRYRYLDNLYWPAEWGMDDKIREDLERGRLFHLLAERYYSNNLGITILEENKLLQAWLDRLKAFCPADDSIVSAEQELRYNDRGMKFLAKYDLLQYNSSKKCFTIYDWKTDKKSLFNKDLKNSMQSRFYLYLFVEAGYQYFGEKYITENMPSIIYWNPRFPSEKIQVKYSKTEFNKDSEFFNDLIKEIKKESEFPLTEDLNICRYCEYRPVCRGKKQEGQELFEEDLDLDLDWESVEEMEF